MKGLVYVWYIVSSCWCPTQTQGHKCKSHFDITTANLFIHDHLQETAISSPARVEQTLPTTTSMADDQYLSLSTEQAMPPKWIQWPKQTI